MSKLDWTYLRSWDFLAAVYNLNFCSLFAACLLKSITSLPASMPIITLRPSLGSLRRKRQASKSKMALVADLVRLVTARAGGDSRAHDSSQCANSPVEYQ